jgi:hypothetical protein
MIAKSRVQCSASEPRVVLALKGHNKPAQGIALGSQGIALGSQGIALGSQSTALGRHASLEFSPACRINPVPSSTRKYD